MNSPKYWEEIDFTIYFLFVKWPVITAVVLELALRLWSFYRVGFLADNYETIAWLIRLAVLAWIGWRVIKNFGGSTAVGAMAGALAGAEIGLIISVSRFFSGIQVWKFFNVITETAMAGVIGSLVAIAMIFIFADKSR